MTSEQWPRRCRPVGGHGCLLLLACALLVAICSGRVEEDNESANDGWTSLLQRHPGLVAEMLLRITVATVVDVNIDAFLKVVVTPILTATGIGALAAPTTFFLGQALAPLIHSICFFHFDDRFVMASLEATGAKERLLDGLGLDEWHRVGFVEKIFVRYGVMKLLAGAFVGLTGVVALVPVLGPLLTALLAGWVVAWDTMYIPLSGLGHVGIFRQGRTVLSNFRAFYWWGFGAVLMEEIPVVGPACHVYNVYSAANFLERVYLGNTTASTDGLSTLKEL